MSEVKTITIDHNNLKLVYDFNELEIEQAELAREVGEFKYHQTEREASNLGEVLRSRGAEWLPIICSYLFKIQSKGEIVPFSRAEAENKLTSHFMKLPIKYRNDMKGAVEDFFSNMGESGITSVILSDASQLKTRAMLLNMAMKMNNDKEKNITKESLPSKKPSKKTA